MSDNDDNSNVYLRKSDGLRFKMIANSRTPGGKAIFMAIDGKYTTRVEHPNDRLAEVFHVPVVAAPDEVQPMHGKRDVLICRRDGSRWEVLPEVRGKTLSLVCRDPPYDRREVPFDRLTQDYVSLAAINKALLVPGDSGQSQSSANLPQPDAVPAKELEAVLHTLADAAGRGEFVGLTILCLSSADPYGRQDGVTFCFTPAGFARTVASLDAARHLLLTNALMTTHTAPTVERYAAPTKLDPTKH